MAYSLVACVSQQFFRCLGELFVEITGKRGARVIGKDTNEHEGIVLVIGPRNIVLFQIVPYDIGAMLGCTGRRFGGLDDGRQVDDLVFGVVGAV